MSGPIEFLSDRPDQRVPASEYGGADGLIQPAPHEPTASEVNAALMRAAQTTDGIDTVTGVSADDLGAG